MKTRHILVFLLLLAAGCAKEPQQENSNDNVAGHIPMVFRAETQEISKVLLSDRVTLNWQVDDKIKIFDGTSDNLAPFVSAASGPAVDFYGKVSNEEGPFYALYPYQEGATFAGGTIYANVPQVQIASAGNVPQNAFIAAAKSDADGLLKFTTVLSYIRFKLVDTDAGNIESMTLSGNSGEQLAGSVKITFDQKSGIPSDVIDSNGQAYSSVILSGSFENGKDYLFAVREQASFSDGVTISILYKNGNRRYISSDANFVNENDAPITITPNMVLNIDQLSATQMNADTPSDRYIAYLHGYDLTIADETYNLAKNGLPTLVKAPEGGSVGISAQIKGRQSGVFFLDSSLGECKLETHTVVAGDLVALVGRYQDQDNILTPKAYLELRGGKFVMCDLDMNLETVKYTSDNSRVAYFIVMGNTLSNDTTEAGDVEAFHMDKCKISNMWSHFLRQDNSSYALKQVRIVNSDFEVDKSLTEIITRILDFSKCHCLNRIEEVTFNNNIVFHRYPETGTIELTCRVIDVEGSETAIPRYSKVNTWNTKISFCNNTMYNVPTPHGFVKFYRVKNLAIQKNICATSDTYNGYSGYLLWLYVYQQTDEVVYAAGDNKFYGLADITGDDGKTKKNWNITNSTSAWKPSPNNPPREPNSPFESIDFDKCIFKHKSQYAKYGAQR